jgi:hypothetical protein
MLPFVLLRSFQARRASEVVMFWLLVLVFIASTVIINCAPDASPVAGVIGLISLFLIAVLQLWEWLYERGRPNSQHAWILIQGSIFTVCFLGISVGTPYLGFPADGARAAGLVFGIGAAVGFTALCNACRERWWHFSARWRDRKATVHNIPAAPQRSRSVEAVPSEELRYMAERLDSQLKRRRALGSVDSEAA